MRVLDLGLMPYREAWDSQIQCYEEVAAGGEDVLILVEHPPVFTLGAGFHSENLLLSEADYEARGIEVVRTDRGGDVTYHGPGQLVAYPIFDLTRHGKDLHRWMRDLEEVFLRVAGEYGLEARRFPPHTGVWVGDEKIAAIGVKIKRWISLHGIALNCDNPLEHFDLIVPCGIVGYGVSSLTRHVGSTVTVSDAKPVVTDAFRSVFRAE